MDVVNVGQRMRWGAWIGFTAGLVFVAMTWDATPRSAMAQDGVQPSGELLPRITALRETPRNKQTTSVSTAGKNAPENKDDTWAIPARSVDLKRAEEIDGKLVQTLHDGTALTFTINPALQKKAADILRYYRVEYGTIVAMNPQTGDILAMAEHAEGRPELRGMALQAEGPAASIFKLVTAAALVEHGNLDATSEICTHGGRRGLNLSLLRDNPKRDKKCQTLAQAMGTSNNVAFGRWAVRNLEPETLENVSERFLFNKRLPFVFGVAMSRANVPSSSELGLAKTAAGFQGTTLSPLHAALLASSVANDGAMMVPRLVESAHRANEELYRKQSQQLAQVMKPSTARELRTMMLETTKQEGSAGRFFHKKKRRKWRQRIPGLSVAGKTGSLSAKNVGATQYYSWFVSLAPSDDPEIVVAALVVNGDVWTVKGAAVAAQLLEYWDQDVRAK
jgi:penicillin-binding protein A